jgi:hypothetical protein
MLGSDNRLSIVLSTSPTEPILWQIITLKVSGERDFGGIDSRDLRMR